MSVIGNLVGSYSQIGKTFVLVDEEGNELTGVATEKYTTLTANDNDVRENSVYAGEMGISTGTKVIPSYHTTEGSTVITANSTFTIKSLKVLDRYDFTKLQAIICPFADSIDQSTAAEKVSINGNVYEVNSNVIIAEITKDTESKQVNFNITNESTTPYILRFFTYKEID